MKTKRTIKQNRPGWRKKRGWTRKAVRTKEGLKKDRNGLVMQRVRIKTKEWEST